MVFSTIRKDHNENMCKMIMGEAHLKYKIYNETYNNVRNCNKTTRTPFTLAKNVCEVEQHDIDKKVHLRTQFFISLLKTKNY